MGPKCALAIWRRCAQNFTDNTQPTGPKSRGPTRDGRLSIAQSENRKRAAWLPAARRAASNSFGWPWRSPPVSRSGRTNGRGGVTRDTPLGGCHVTSRCPATPAVTHRDNVTPCHSVTHLRSWLKAKAGNRVFSGDRCWGQPVGRTRARLDRPCRAAHRPQGCAL
jgi:hypothetical protein